MNRKITALILGTLILTGCETTVADGYKTGIFVENGAWKVIGDHGEFDILRDVKTGCLYLQSHSGYNSITEYYDEDGKVAGCGEEELNKEKYE